MPMIWEGVGVIIVTEMLNYILELNVYLWKKVKVQFVKYNSYYSL